MRTIRSVNENRFEILTSRPFFFECLKIKPVCPLNSSEEIMTLQSLNLPSRGVSE